MRPAGSDQHAELARWLRVYGGPSLETKRDAAHVQVRASGFLIVALTLLVPLVAAWGFAVLAWFGADAWLVLLAVFLEAVHRRDRLQNRIDQVEAICAEAIRSALAEGERPDMGVPA
jgi:hypothetical protein